MSFPVSVPFDLLNVCEKNNVNLKKLIQAITQLDRGGLGYITEINNHTYGNVFVTSVHDKIRKQTTYEVHMVVSGNILKTEGFFNVQISAHKLAKILSKSKERINSSEQLEKTIDKHHCDCCGLITSMPKKIFTMTNWQGKSMSVCNSCFYKGEKQLNNSINRKKRSSGLCRKRS